MRTKLKKAIQLIVVIMIGILIVATVVVFAHKSANRVMALGSIPPPEGYPKLTLSTKVVTPTLTTPDGQVLTYTIRILNTGAYQADNVTLVDTLPVSTTYNGNAKASASPVPTYTTGTLTWGPGVVGFDSSLVITFSVTVTPGYEGIVKNRAEINAPLLAKPVTAEAETRVTDHPIFEISKSATPALPGQDKPVTYELVVTNEGQPAVNTPITVTDFVPIDTTFLKQGPDGSFNSTDKVATWNRTVDLGFGDTSTFTFSVNVDAPAGTVITNSTYSVVGAGAFGYGQPYTTTVVDPKFILSKSVLPDPPGSNHEMTYTLTVLNLGSEATDLVITDNVPQGVTYIRGGSYLDGTVTWELTSLDSHKSAQVSYVVYIGDVADVIIQNNDYQVCSAEGVCAQGLPVSSLVVGPTFEATASLNPIAKKPGAGTGPVTPTLTIRNVGPGNALDATASLTFQNIQVGLSDLEVIPSVGNLGVGAPCNPHCVNYVWTGDISVGDVITFTTFEGQNTQIGSEGSSYTATVVITDSLGTYVTEPVTAQAVGHITHLSNLVPTKSAPAEIGPGQTMTYTIQVFNSGLSTDTSQPPLLQDTVPPSVTLVNIGEGGTSQVVDGKTVVSWVLPAMSPGDYQYRTFSVLVDPDLISGTVITNKDYQTIAYQSAITGTKIVMGNPVSTVVHEVGLIDSYKTVSPTWALPGKGTVLTYVIHVVNSGPTNLSGVKVNDIFPWQNTTYQRDAVATGGSLDTDIVSLEWTGNVNAYSQQLITFTVLVDDYFAGVITNTATIIHPSLSQPVLATALAYITDKPVLRITKTATPDPVVIDHSLLYQIHVTNLGQQATLLKVTDSVPENTTYIESSASSSGQLVGDAIQWMLPVLEPGGTISLTYQVIVNGGNEITNDNYFVSCDEGVTAYGKPVITIVKYPLKEILFPVMDK